MAAFRHLGFGTESCETTHEGPFVVAISCKNFVMIGVVVFKLYEFVVLHA